MRGKREREDARLRLYPGRLRQYRRRGREHLISSSLVEHEMSKTTVLVVTLSSVVVRRVDAALVTNDMPPSEDQG